MGTFAQNLRSALDDRRWNISDLNKAMGRRGDSTSAYTWLMGKHVPRQDAIEKIAKALSISPAQLMNGTNGHDATGLSPPKPPSQDVQSKWAFAADETARLRIAVDLAEILREAGVPSHRLREVVVQIIQRCFK